MSYSLLTLLGLAEIIKNVVLPGVEAVTVHEPALVAGVVVADELDTGGNVKNLFSLSSSQTQEILKLDPSLKFNLITE